MNTDNMAVSGETIDFGPCAFMDAFHPQCVFSSIDRNGRYAWGNQPPIGEWNLTRLAETLLPLLAKSQDDARVLAEAALDEFGVLFQAHYHSGFRAKLGIPAGVPEDAAVSFIKETLTLMANEQVDFTLFFRNLTRVAAGSEGRSFESLFPQRETCTHWLEKWRAIATDTPALDAMRTANPVIIPRNHRIEEAIHHAYEDDYAPFHRLAEALAHPREESAKTAEYERPPEPHEVVHHTFCGT
jgi:serine/tyrosine/threonine adenylyltransferase